MTRTRVFPLVAALLLAVFACERKPGSESLPSPLPTAATATPIPTVAEAPPEQAESLAAMVEEFERVQREADSRSREMLALLERYRQKGGQLPPQLTSELTDEQRQVLTERVEKERPELRRLLQDALDRDRQLQTLKAEIVKLRPSLPDSVVAQPGDRHDRLVLGFLQNKSIPELEARRLIDQINLQEPLLPSFRVWLYLGSDASGRRIFSTWVTQGTAPISPQEAQRRVREALESERARAVAGADKLKAEVAALEQRKAGLEREIGLLQDEAGALLRQMGELKRKADVAENAARYVAGSRKQLRQEGVIGDSLFGSPRVKKLENLQILDLQATTDITLDSSAYGLTAIKKVTLLPDSLKRDLDYNVTLIESGAFAKVRLVNPQKFRRSTFVIVVE